MTITTEMAHIGKSWWRKTLDLPEDYFHCQVLLKAGTWPSGPQPTAQDTLHSRRPGGPVALRPTAQGPAAHFIVHIPWSSLEFLSAVLYSTCSDLCSKMEEGEFWFLCNFHCFNPLKSLYLFVALCSTLVLITVYVCLFTEPDSTVDVETMQVWTDLKPLLHFAITFEELQSIETIKIAKKPKLTFFHFGTQIRTCAVKQSWQKF